MNLAAIDRLGVGSLDLLLVSSSTTVGGLLRCDLLDTTRRCPLLIFHRYQSFLRPMVRYCSSNTRSRRDGKKACKTSLSRKQTFVESNPWSLRDGPWLLAMLNAVYSQRVKSQEHPKIFSNERVRLATSAQIERVAGPLNRGEMAALLFTPCRRLGPPYRENSSWRGYWGIHQTTAPASELSSISLWSSDCEDIDQNSGPWSANNALTRQAPNWF